MSNQTVAEVLASADDSVTLINDINTNGSDSVHVPMDVDQDGINDIVQRNVDHLEIILAYDGSSESQPDVAGSSDDKSSYTSAITTGKAYISSNS
jgi:hypothetical protein